MASEFEFFKKAIDAILQEFSDKDFLLKELNRTLNVEENDLLDSKSIDELVSLILKEEKKDNNLKFMTRLQKGTSKLKNEAKNLELRPIFK